MVILYLNKVKSSPNNLINCKNKQINTKILLKIAPCTSDGKNKSNAKERELYRRQMEDVTEATLSVLG